jgi:hypothetical protein
MGEVSLRDWLALLSEAGVKFSAGSRSGSGLRTAVEAAAGRVELTLESGDLAILSDLEDMLSPSPKPNRDFNRRVVCHIQQLEDVPTAPVPEDDGGRIQTRQYTDPSVTPTLPPFGRMEEKLEAASNNAVVPIHWKPTDGSSVTMRKWREWRKGLIDGIASMLWPVYVPGGAPWGSPSVGKLLEADFQLLNTLHWQLGMPIDARYPTKVVHGELFTEEDDGATPFGTGYDRYDPTVAPLVSRGLPTVLIAGMADKVGTLDLQLKQVFQRPRPYQVALLQDRTNYSYRWARTGNTPSLVSGHCLQASIAGCTAYVAFAESMTEGSMELLQQFTVDVGDRRVFAGIHYPSDNLASWYVALNLVQFVFDVKHRGMARQFLALALSKSKVFAAVNAYKDSEGNSPYRKIIDAINGLGAG